MVLFKEAADGDKSHYQIKKEDVWVSAYDEQRKRIRERTLKHLSKKLRDFCCACPLGSGDNSVMLTEMFTDSLEFNM